MGTFTGGSVIASGRGAWRKEKVSSPGGGRGAWGCSPECLWSSWTLASSSCTLHCNWTTRPNNSSWLKDAISSGELMVCNVAYRRADRNPVGDTAISYGTRFRIKEYLSEIR
jgi:hypothetical protein